MSGEPLVAIVAIAFLLLIVGVFEYADQRMHRDDR